RGMAVEGSRRGELVEPERTHVVAAARVVHRQRGRALAGARAPAGLLPPPDVAMETDATCRRDPFVEDAPIERVLEAVPSRHRSAGPLRDAGAHEERPAGGELLARVRDLLGVRLQGGGDGGDGELVARDARRLEHLADRWREVAQPATDQLLEPARNPIGRRL